MKKTLLLAAALTFGLSGTYAETLYTITLGSVIKTTSELAENTDYIMLDAAGTTSYVFTESLSSGTTILTKTTAPSTTYNDETFKQYIVQVKANSDGTYALYFPYVGSGEYLPEVSQSGTFTTVSQSDAFGYSVSDAANGILFQVGENKMFVNSYAKSGYLSGNSGNGAYSQWKFKAITWTESSSQTVTYNLKWNGSTIKTESVEAAAGSAASAFLPSSWSKDFVEFEYDTETITSSTSNVNVTATWNGPFEISSSYSNATWYWMQMKSKESPYAYYDESLDYIPLSASADLDDDAAMWALTGDPFNGFSVLNKAAGSSMIMSTDDPSSDGSNGGNTFATMESSGTKTYEVFFALNSTHADNGFFLENSQGYKLNDFSNNKKIAYWTAGFGAGSTFVLSEPSYSLAEFASYFNTDSVDVYYGLTQSGYNALKSDYDNYASSCTKAQYEAFKSKLESNIKKPTSGWYRIKNYSFKAYAGNNEYGAVSSLSNTDVASVVYIEQNSSDESQYAIKIGGKYLQAPCSGQIPLGDEPAYYTFETAQAGIIRAAGVTYTDYQFMNETGKNGNFAICGWVANSLSANPGSYWLIEDATAATYSLTEVNGATYTTICLPYDATFSSDDVKAYTVSVAKENGKDVANLTELSSAGTIPANLPILLKGEATTSLELSIPGTDNGGSESTDIEGSLLYLGENEIDGYVLGIYNSDIAFCKAGEATTLAAYKAYLPTSAVPAGARSLTLNFGDATGIGSVENAVENGKIYDLTGREVKQMRRGLYIVNGKKLVK